MLLASASLALAERADAAGVVGPNGQISGCYKAKGKAKGTLRVTPKKKCRKGEKRVAWNVRGPAGPQGQQGAPGSGGGTTDLSALEARVAQLEAILAGISNTELQDAIDAVADVQALCTQVTSLTTTLNLLNTAVAGIDLLGIIPPGLGLDIPSLPAQLAPFGCPA